VTNRFAGDRVDAKWLKLATMLGIPGSPLVVFLYVGLQPDEIAACVPW
jgi:hypothetical protein